MQAMQVVPAVVHRLLLEPTGLDDVGLRRWVVDAGASAIVRNVMVMLLLLKVTVVSLMTQQWTLLLLRLLWASTGRATRRISRIFYSDCISPTGVGSERSSRCSRRRCSLCANHRTTTHATRHRIVE